MSMNYQISKRQNHINTFILARDKKYINDIVNTINNLCATLPCRYEIKYSFIDNFIYIKIYEATISLNELKHKIEIALEELKDNISWIKTEIIEIK